jgi:hypothetical protein
VKNQKEKRGHGKMIEYENLIFTDGSIFSNIWACEYRIHGGFIQWISSEGMEYEAFIISQEGKNLICEWAE